MEKKTKDIKEIVLRVALEIAKSGEGALFVIGNNVQYKRLMKQKMHDFSIFDDGSYKLLKSLGVIDGAVIINSEGIVKDYGVLIQANSVAHGFGTRHSAAISASYKNLVILCSEEERKVKVFSKGKYIMELDPMKKGAKQSVEHAAQFLESIGVGTIGFIGVSILAPAIGITLAPGVIIFGASYYVLQRLWSKR